MGFAAWTAAAASSIGLLAAPMVFVLSFVSFTSEPTLAVATTCAFILGSVLSGRMATAPRHIVEGCAAAVIFVVASIGCWISPVSAVRPAAVLGTTACALSALGVLWPHIRWRNQPSPPSSG